MEELSVKKTQIGPRRNPSLRFRPAKLQSLASMEPPLHSRALRSLSPRNIPALFEISQCRIGSSDPVSSRSRFPSHSHRLKRCEVLSEITLKPRR